METLQALSETLDRLRENQEALSHLDATMKFEKEALSRTQESLMAHLDFLKGEYQKMHKLFSKIKFCQEKREVYEKLLSFNRLLERPLTGYLPLFRESQVHVRRRRLNKAKSTVVRYQ